MSGWEVTACNDPEPADVVDLQPPPSGGRRWALVAALVLVLLGGWRLQQSGLGDRSTLVDRTHRTSPDPPSLTEQRTPRLLPLPAGSRAVGNGVLMLAIPADWASNATRCDRSAAVLVRYGPEPVGADPPARDRPSVDCAENPTASGGPASTVAFTTYHLQQHVLPTASPVAEIAGKTLLESSLTSRGGAYERVLVMPADHLVVLVRSPSLRVVNAISRSAAEVPHGYRAVPQCVGLSVTRAEATLAASGFRAQMFSDPGAYGRFDLHVVTQAPGMGIIASIGTTVALGLLPK